MSFEVYTNYDHTFSTVARVSEHTRFSITATRIYALCIYVSNTIDTDVQIIHKVIYKFKICHANCWQTFRYVILKRVRLKGIVAHITS